MDAPVLRLESARKGNGVGWGKKIVPLLLFIIAVSLISLGYLSRYKYWHFYVHNRLNIFLDKEFKGLIEKYGTGDNYASIEEKDHVGVLITFLKRKDYPYAIQFRLSKNISINTFEFRAEIASPIRKSHYNTGTPPIYVNIPMQYYGDVLRDGLSKRQIERLFETAYESKWRPLKNDKQTQVGQPVVLPYSPRPGH